MALLSHWGFIWEPVTLTQTLLLEQQALYPLSHILSFRSSKRSLLTKLENTFVLASFSYQILKEKLKEP